MQNISKYISTKHQGYGDRFKPVDLCRWSTWQLKSKERTLIAKSVENIFFYKFLQSDKGQKSILFRSIPSLTLGVKGCRDWKCHTGDEFNRNVFIK